MKKKKTFKEKIQAMKVASSNTLRTRIVKNKKWYVRKTKHKKDVLS